MQVFFFLLVILGCGKDDPDNRPNGKVGATQVETKKPKIVVLFTSHSEQYVQHILNLFTKKTNIRVRVVSEKGEKDKVITDLSDRIILNRKTPEADVYWSESPLRAEKIKFRGAAELIPPHIGASIPNRFRDPDHKWIGFSARALYLYYNDNTVKKNKIPKSLFDYPDMKTFAFLIPKDPNGGPYIGGLFSAWGKTKTENFFQKIDENHLPIYRNISTVKEALEGGNIGAILIGSEYLNYFKEDKDLRKELYSVKKILPAKHSDGVLLVPDVLVSIKNAPHPQARNKLIEFLVSKEIEALLTKPKYNRIALGIDVKSHNEFININELKVMQTNWQDAFAMQKTIKKFLGEFD